MSNKPIRLKTCLDHGYRNWNYSVIKFILIWTSSYKCADGLSFASKEVYWKILQRNSDSRKRIKVFSRVLRDSICHFLVGLWVRPSVRPSIRPSVTKSFKGFLSRFSCHWMVEKKRGVVNSCLKGLFEKKIVCLPAWLFLKVPTHAIMYDLVFFFCVLWQS